MTKHQLELIKAMERDAEETGGLAFGEIDMLRYLISEGCSESELRLMTRDRFTREALLAFKAEWIARQNAAAIQMNG